MKISVTCTDPTPTNGQVNSTAQSNGRYIIGTTVSFMCDTGYHLEGSASSTCQFSGSWNPSPPTCPPGKKENVACSNIWWLVELPNRFTTATHKCVSLLWWTFFGTFNIYAYPCLNVETKLRVMVGKLNQRKNWINGKFSSAILSFWVQKGHSSFPSVRTLVSAIMENGKNGHSSPKMCPRAKLPITDPPKDWVSGFLSVDGNSKLVLAIMEDGKNGHSSPKTRPRAKLPITDPLKFGSPVFWVLTEMQNWCQSLWKMEKCP